ncbi:putative histone deacetylase complex subunit cti6, partial [Neolecta irregularis DAH-3]
RRHSVCIRAVYARRGRGSVQAPALACAARLSRAATSPPMPRTPPLRPSLATLTPPAPAAHTPSRRSTRGKQKSKSNSSLSANETHNDPLDWQEEITRCICGQDESPVLGSVGMIQCEQCHAWQHFFCIGLDDSFKEEIDYFCELCRPDHHDLYQDEGIPRSKWTPHDGTRGPRKSSPKRRSTMNSRDAAYERDIQLAIEASAAEKAMKPPSVRGKKRATSESSEKAGDPKRPRTSASPSSSANRQHESDNDRDSSLSTRRKRKPVAQPADPPPQSKSRLSDEKAPPRTRNMREKRKDGNDSDNSEITNQSQQSKSRAPRSTSRLPPPAVQPPEPEPKKLKTTTGTRKGARNNHDTRRGAQSIKTASEAPSPPLSDGPFRPKTVNSRASLNEMRKRVQVILEYISHVQVEMASCSTYQDRKKTMPSSSSSTSSNISFVDVKLESGAIVGELTKTAALIQSTTSLNLIDSLTRQLLHWEQKYGKAGTKC